VHESLQLAFSPALTDFTKRLLELCVRPSSDSPETLAHHFVQAFRLPCPIEFKHMGVLLYRLAYRDVVFHPGLEEELDVRGLWMLYGDVVCIMIDPDRPPASQIKTLLHELCEQILEISYSLDPSLPVLSGRDREHFASRFAAMCKMPPDIFARDAEETGLDLRELAELYKDTIAGVSRQIRDLVAVDKVFYTCRFEVVHKPEKECAPLLQLIEKSDGLPVRIADVVRTRRVRTRRRRGGALPAYNLPSNDHFRIMHHALHKYVNTMKPFYIPRLVGGAAGDGGWSDLYRLNDLAIVVRPYGYKRTEGFFLLAIHPDDVPGIQSQLDRISAEERTDIEWLFSWASHTVKRGRRHKVQPGLAIRDAQGNVIGDLSKEEYPWPVVQPEPSIGHDERREDEPKSEG
jgi:hypothetical protein